MVWPSPRRAAIFISFLIWIFVQIFFFLPPACGKNFVLESREGQYQIFQNAREAVLIGAYSDRYQRFPKMELIPFLRKKGIRKISSLTLTGHEKDETGALKELQKNFQVIEVRYPSASALKMRRTFQQIQSSVRLTRLDFNDLSSEKTD